MSLTPPAPARRPHSLVTHGDERIDDWYWLRERDNPDVIAHLEAENAWTEERLAPLETLRKELFDDIRRHVQETWAEAPYARNGWWYYSRREESRQYAVHCRRRHSDEDPVSPVSPEALAAPEQVVIDANSEAEGLEFFALGALEISPSGAIAAWASDATGQEHYTVRFRDIAAGSDREEVIEGAAAVLAWGDETCVFYVTRDAAERPYRVWRHDLGGDGESADTLVFEETDASFGVRISRLRSGEYVSIISRSKVTAEVRLIPTNDPRSEARIVAPRTQGVDYSVDHRADDLWIVTNLQALDFRLMRAPIASRTMDDWQEVIPHRPKTRLVAAQAFARWIALVERSEGCLRVQLLDPDSLELNPIEVSEQVSTLAPDANADFDPPVYRYSYSSMITPSSVFDLDPSTGESTLVQQVPVPEYDPADYRTERRWAPAPDGTLVPLSVLWRDGTAFDGSAPCLLYGYGSYEISMDPTFNPLRLPWLDRGGVWVIAHVRGGGEMGRSWYDDGKLDKKSNTFTDFIAAAEHLVEEGITSPERLAIRGGSAGGLLIGAVVNLRPELFKAAVAEVPFVDCLTTILDESLPLTVIEWDEWGNPNDPVFYEVMKDYSPYDNVVSQAYPRLLVTAGLNDPRVSYWEPAKWVARLRERQLGNSEILLKTQMGAGHQGPSGRYAAWEESAFVMAFMLDALGAGLRTARLGRIEVLEFLDGSRFLLTSTRRGHRRFGVGLDDDSPVG